MARTLADRYAELREQVAAAAHRSGRRGDDVTIVAVTKAAPPEIFATARRAGITDVGENRLPQALSRMAGHETAFRWHFVGHVQSNKVRKAVPAFDVFHGVDSMPLMLRIDRVAEELGRRPELLLQVNVSGEASKQGLTPVEVAEAVQAAGAMRAARLVGLMTMAPLVTDPEEARPVFAALAALRDELASMHRLPHLSMGMSDDFVVAVEEGATMVRVGTRLVAGGAA